MEINKNNFIIIGAETDKKGELNDGKFSIEERSDDGGTPGKVQKCTDGEGDVEKITENFIKEGFDPKKIIINGKTATDVLELTKTDLKDIKRAKIRLGLYGFIKMGKFSEEDVAEMNKTKKLPEGYNLIFRPQMNYYYNFVPAGNNPAHFELTKSTKKQIKFWNGRNVKFTNKIPKDYEVVNDNGKTYLKEKNVEISQAKKDFKKGIYQSLAIIGGLFAAGFGIIALINRKGK